MVSASGIVTRGRKLSIHPNPGVLVISRIAHPSQIIPLVKYWIPEVEVIQPASIRNQIIDDICRAFKRYSSTDDGSSTGRYNEEDTAS